MSRRALIIDLFAFVAMVATFCVCSMPTPTTPAPMPTPTHVNNDGRASNVALINDQPVEEDVDERELGHRPHDSNMSPLVAAANNRASTAPGGVSLPQFHDEGDKGVPGLAAR
jgi:hypothetical protein